MRIRPQKCLPTQPKRMHQPPTAPSASTQYPGNDTQPPTHSNNYSVFGNVDRSRNCHVDFSSRKIHPQRLSNDSENGVYWGRSMQFDLETRLELLASTKGPRLDSSSDTGRFRITDLRHFFLLTSRPRRFTHVLAVGRKLFRFRTGFWREKGFLAQASLRSSTPVSSDRMRCNSLPYRT